MGNFDDLSRVRNSFFNHQASPCYDNEKKLYNKLLSEAYNKHGIKCWYYFTDYSQTNDTIYAEDMDRHIIRKVPIMAYFELPPEDRISNFFGLEEMDNYNVFISKEHLAAVSTFNHSDTHGDTSGTYDITTPKSGDVLYSTHNERLYEVLFVKDTEEMFLQDKHTWNLSVQVFKDSHISLSATTSASMPEVSAVTNQPDILEINDDIDTKKTNVLYEPGTAEEPSKDPFANWS
jgi:hypothetical protein